jgi:cytochrome c556
MNRISIAAITMLCSVAALRASVAQMGPQTPEQEAEKAVKTRQGLFDVQAFAFGPVGAMLKGAPYDAALVQKEAARVQMTAGLIHEVFVFDSRKFQVKTKAREIIWTQKSDFDKKATDLQTTAAKLESVAKIGDQAAVLKAVEAVGQSCKSCHDDYRDK